jgi:hypothetical protein
MVKWPEISAPERPAREGAWGSLERSPEVLERRSEAAGWG